MSKSPTKIFTNDDLFCVRQLGTDGYTHTLIFNRDDVVGIRGLTSKYGLDRETVYGTLATMYAANAMITIDTGVGEQIRQPAVFITRIKKDPGHRPQYYALHPLAYGLFEKIYRNPERAADIIKIAGKAHKPHPITQTLMAKKMVIDNVDFTFVFSKRDFLGICELKAMYDYRKRDNIYTTLSKLWQEKATISVDCGRGTQVVLPVVLKTLSHRQPTEKVPYVLNPFALVLFNKKYRELAHNKEFKKAQVNIERKVKRKKETQKKITIQKAKATLLRIRQQQAKGKGNEI